MVTKSRPYQSKEDTQDFGTLKKVEILDHGWEMVRKSLFSDVSDEEAVTIPDFGVEPMEMEGMLVNDHFFHRKKRVNGNTSHGKKYATNDTDNDNNNDNDGNLSEKAVKGVQLITMFLYAARENLGIEYCPLLPDMTALLLSHMPVSYAYASIREMANTEEYYFPMSKVEHFSWCKTFGDLMRRMYPQTAIVMARCGALTPDGLDPIFRRFFVPIMKREQVLRILDIYFIEGYKAIFRLGTVILCLCTYYLTPSETTSAAAFWKGVKRVTHSKIFHFSVLIKQSYGFNGRTYRSSRSFPRRRFIQKLVNYNSQWASSFVSNHILGLTDKPVGFVDGALPIVLAKNAAERYKLAEFLPFSYKATKLDLIYSTNHHGRSVEMFYKHCAKAKHTIALVEVLNNGSIIGMFATDTWRNNRKMYGDGECFMFRLKPDPVAYHWQHQITDSMRQVASVDSTDDENVNAVNMNEKTDGENDESQSIKSEGLIGQFMISRGNFISLGNNEDGLSGLRLNDDLSKGSSAKARGFNNEPLAGAEYPEFDVGLIEVYQLVREIDGRAIDGEEDVWKGMFD